MHTKMNIIRSNVAFILKEYTIQATPTVNSHFPTPSRVSNIKDSEGTTPMHLAAAQGHTACLRCVLVLLSLFAELLASWSCVVLKHHLSFSFLLSLFLTQTHTHTHAYTHSHRHFLSTMFMSLVILIAQSPVRQTHAHDGSLGQRRGRHASHSKCELMLMI